MSFQELSGGNLTPTGGRGRGPDLKTLGEGRYRVINLIGRGGMAVVYHAYDSANDRDVAIKVLSLDLSGEESFLARFQRESELMRDLNHPNILRAYDFGQENELVYLVMSYYGGGTLKERINRTPLPLATVADFLSQIANGLGYAHSRGIIHRDVKPSNVLLHHASDKLVLSDFGIAKALSNVNSNRTGTIMGTPLYMAPEQFLAGGDQRSDIYALGIVLYQMLTGEVPFKGENIGFKHMTDPVPPLRTFGLNYDRKIEAVVTRALAKRPEARYQKVEDLNRAFQDAVREYAQSETQQAAPEMLGEASEGEGPSGILPGQDSLSAVPVVVPTTTPLAKLSPEEREALRSSNPLLFQATDQAAPIVLSPSRNPVANNPNGPTFPMPVNNSGPVAPPSRPYTPLQQSRPRPDLSITRSRPLDDDDTGEFTALKTRRKGLNPLFALLAGVLVVLALGGGGLFFVLNNSNPSSPTVTGGSLLPGGLTSTPAGVATTAKPNSATPITVAPTTAGGSPVTGALPRNMRLVFTSNDNSSSGNNKQNIFYYDQQTGQLKQLTNSDRDSLAVWSPGGNMIVFQRFREDKAGYDIWLMSADGSGQKKIVDRAYNPAFRNHGSEIVYYSELDKDLYTKLVDGTNATPLRLTNDGRAKFGPVFSPDDTKIAYAQEDDSGTRQIFIVDNKPGATPFQVTRCSAFNCIWPSWSPDGKQLAFSTNEKTGAGLAGEIWTVNLNGSQPTAIVSQSNGGHNSHPLWVQDNRSKTGTRIYFNSDRGEGNNARIYVTDPDGANQQLFVKHPGPKGDNDSPLQDYGVSIFLLGN